MNNIEATTSEQSIKSKKKEHWLSSWTSLIFFCVILPLAFRSLFFAPFHIPSSSMKSTMLIGDYLFVNKSVYGYSKYSFPFGIEFANTRFNNPEPLRGDVIVFRPTPTPNVDFIKRLIGLPGDTIQVRRGRLYLNGQAVKREYVDMFADEENGETRQMKRYLETLPNGTSYHVLDDYEYGNLDNTPVFTVPENNYFVMGDNRDHSADSRTPTVGFLPRENLVGRAEIIFVSSKTPLWQVWHWFDNFRDDRYFKSIQLEENSGS